MFCVVIFNFVFIFSLSALNHQINFRPFSTKFQFHTSSLDSVNLRNWSLVFPNFMPCYFPHMEKVRTKKIRLFDSRILTLFGPETSDNGKKGGRFIVFWGSFQRPLALHMYFLKFWTHNHTLTRVLSGLS